MAPKGLSRCARQERLREGFPCYRVPLGADPPPQASGPTLNLNVPWDLCRLGHKPSLPCEGIPSGEERTPLILISDQSRLAQDPELLPQALKPIWLVLHACELHIVQDLWSHPPSGT